MSILSGDPLTQLSFSDAENCGRLKKLHHVMGHDLRKVTDGFRSWRGAHGHVTIRSVIGTGALHGLPPLQAIEHAIAGTPIFVTT